jgi:pilus assembly protein Flp/PilA
MRQKGWIEETGLYRALWMRLRRDVRAQDLIEYALMAGFIAVASAAVMPQIASSISTVFSKISSVMAATAAS